MENIEQSVMVNVKLEKEDAGEYSTIILKAKMNLTKRQLFLLAVTAIIFAILLIYTLITKNESSVLSSVAGNSKVKISIWPIGLFFLFMLYRIGMPILSKVIAMRQFDKNKLLHNEIIYTFSADGISAQTEDRTINWKWVEVFKVIETKQYFAILESNQSANVIPKRCFASDQDSMAAAKLIKNYLPKTKYELIQA